MSNFGKTDLQLLVNQYLGLEPNTPFPSSLTRQVNRLILEQDFDYQEIADCVVYFQEALNKQMDNVHGFWFAENVRAAAKQYKLQQEAIKKNKLEDAKKFDLQNEVMVINIKEIVKHKPSRRLSQLDFDDIELEDGDDDGNK